MHQWQTDIVDMSSLANKNSNYKYILTIIDVFSKIGFAFPLKTKSGPEVANVLSDVFKQHGAPIFLQSDKGLEFLNKHVRAVLKEFNITSFSSESELKAQIVERFNRTLKGKMYKYFTAKNTKRWLEVLPDLVENYNNSYHRSIKMTPAEVNEKNKDIVYNNLYKQTITTKPRYKIGEKVRIYKKEGDFKKGYTPKFTMEIFKIHEINSTQPPTYVLKDMDNEIIIGSFYEAELSKI